ncbi:MAG: M17 family peptidase N-terminal domain-containing protein, partial [Candidatus Heimdallarchaeaceae archaeon]
MKIEVKVSKTVDFEVPLLLVGVLEEVAEDKILEQYDEAVLPSLKLKDFKGKKGDLSILYTNNLISPKRILLVGLGKKEELELETIRKMVGSASRKARNLNVNLIGIDTYSFSRNMIDLEKASEALVQSIIMGTFQNLRYKTKDKEKFNQIDSIALVSSLEDKETIEKGAYSGKIIGDAVNFCRTLSWSPANYITPTKLAQEAIRLEKEL